MADQKLLLESGEIAEAVARGDIIPVDCRSKGDYLNGHIPRAVSFPANEWIDPESPVAGLRPWEELAAALGSRGIGRHDRLAIYDDSGLVASSRLFWILEAMGHSGAAILNGGFSGRTEGMNAVQVGEAARPPALYEPELRSELIADSGEILERISKSDATIIDARSPGEFSGEVETADRNGHIPGAVNIDWQGNIVDLMTPRFISPAELLGRYGNGEWDASRRIICYCRSGNRSAHSYFALRLLGFTDVANYPGSWLEWGNNPQLPVSAGGTESANAVLPNRSPFTLNSMK